MKIAIFETILMPAGHESEFDKILVDEIKDAGHEPIFFVPQNYPFKMDYKCPVHHLKFEAVSYANVSKFKKIFLSIKREIKRILWLNQVAKICEVGFADAVLVPTCTYRFLRSIKFSKLKKTKTLLIMHGINPNEMPKFKNAVSKAINLKNIHIGVLTLRNADFKDLSSSNLHTILPPIFTAWALEKNQNFKPKQTLKFGFFGQYRKEKNLDFILESFCKAKFNRPVELIVQGSTPTREDELDFLRLQDKYLNHENIKFIHKSLIGKEWQEALMSVDILLIPYGAKRYLYHYSAMLFTAIGFNKPVLQSKLMSPEVLNEFKIGEFVNLDDTETFGKQIEIFANEFESKFEIYQNALKNAASKYDGANLANEIIKILSE